MCDPVTMGAGMALKLGAGNWSRGEAVANAERQANARNNVLQNSLWNLQGIYNNTNDPAFKGAVGAIDPANLGKAQDARTNAIMSNVKAPPGGFTPTDGASPAVAADRAKTMKTAMDFVGNQGAATGKLGGYGDQWFNSNLEEQNAARKVGVGNLFANEEKSLISPRQDLAEAAAYKTPSWIPGLLGGAGDMLGSYSGSKGAKNSIGSLFGGMGGGSTPAFPEGGASPYPYAPGGIF